MELASGFLLWLLVDVCGINAIKKESNIYKKVLKVLAFFIVGFVCIVLYSIIKS